MLAIEASLGKYMAFFMTVLMKFLGGRTCLRRWSAPQKAGRAIKEHTQYTVEPGKGTTHEKEIEKEEAVENGKDAEAHQQPCEGKEWRT